jgi:hypothetical protein
MSPVEPTDEDLNSKGNPTEGVVNQSRIEDALMNALAKKQAESKQAVTNQAVTNQAVTNQAAPKQPDSRKRRNEARRKLIDNRMSKAEAQRIAEAQRKEAERLNAERQEAERLNAQRIADQRSAVDREETKRQQAEAKAKKQAEAEQAISNINVQKNTALQNQALEAEIKRQDGLNPESQANLESEQAFRKAQMEQFNQQFALANKPEQAQQQTAVTSNTNTKPTSWFKKVTSPFNKKGGSNKNRTLKKREQNIKIRLV